MGSKGKRDRIGWFAILAVVILVCVVTISSSPAAAADKKPNILVIMSDDIGIWNISAYHRGMMGGRTPKLDRIANEGALFTDYYGQQSCTAGRSAFITGQHPFRVGLLKVGMPGAKQGLQDKDPTIAELLKAQGYTTAQVGKNHLGDRNEYLPTVHGFDEFFGRDVERPEGRLGAERRRELLAEPLREVHPAPADPDDGEVLRRPRLPGAVGDVAGQPSHRAFDVRSLHDSP